MRFLLPLLLLPLLEIAGFAWVGSQVGALNTVLLVLLSGIVGLLLLQRTGLEGVRRAQMGLRSGETEPMRQMFGGLCTAFSAILLIIPGFITDILALILFLPPVRQALLARMTIFMQVDGQTMRSRPRPGGGNPVIDVEYQEMPGRDDPAGDLPPPDSKWRSPDPH